MPFAFAGYNLYLKQFAADAGPGKAGADAGCCFEAYIVFQINYLAEIFM